jgi:uncharacterized membrane protein YphA (DoxX/SURF4 family)
MDRRHAIISMVEWLLRLGIGGVFIYAGFLKAMDPAKFTEDVAAYHLLSYHGAVITALYLPWLEMVCGVGLIVGWMRSGATALLLALTLVFITAILSARARGLDISCGCFGTISRSTEVAWMLIRNGLILAGLVVMTLISFSARWSRRFPQNTSEPQKTG